MERDKEPNTNSIERSRAQTGSSGSNVKLQDHNHNREVVFALPSLRLHFKTEHAQGATTPDISGNAIYKNSSEMAKKKSLFLCFPEEKPVVECSFITEFEDHIFVTVDADAFFFLHDLITSYLKEKERVVMEKQYIIPHLQCSYSNKFCFFFVSFKIGAQNIRSSSPNPAANVINSHIDTNGTNSMGPLSNNSSGSSSAVDGIGSSTLRKSFGKADALQAGIINAKLADKKTTTEKIEIDAFIKDWRHFECKTWHLEPTVRYGI